MSAPVRTAPTGPRRPPDADAALRHAARESPAGTAPGPPPAARFAPPPAWRGRTPAPGAGRRPCCPRGRALAGPRDDGCDLAQAVGRGCRPARTGADPGCADPPLDAWFSPVRQAPLA